MGHILMMNILEVVGLWTCVSSCFDVYGAWVEIASGMVNAKVQFAEAVI